jgi:hypothetical protein
MEKNIEEKTIDEIFIKISGKMPIVPKLEPQLGVDQIISIEASAVKKEIFDNQDGSVSLCYIMKPTGWSIEPKEK